MQDTNVWSLSLHCDISEGFSFYRKGLSKGLGGRDWAWFKRNGSLSINWTDWILISYSKGRFHRQRVKTQQQTPTIIICLNNFIHCLDMYRTDLLSKNSRFVKNWVSLLFIKSMKSTRYSTPIQTWEGPMRGLSMVEYCAERRIYAR